MPSTGRNNHINEDMHYCKTHCIRMLLVNKLPEEGTIAEVEVSNSNKVTQNCPKSRKKFCLSNNWTRIEFRQADLSRGDSYQTRQ
jgi:hypothetical protein